MQQRDARVCTAKAGFFRSEDNSPSSGHVTRRPLLCQYVGSIIPEPREITIAKTNKNQKSIAVQIVTGINEVFKKTREML